MDRGFVQPRRVVFDTDGFLCLVERNSPYTIDFANPGNRQCSSFRRRHPIPVQNIQLCHAIDHTKTAIATASQILKLQLVESNYGNLAYRRNFLSADL